MTLSIAQGGGAQGALALSDPPAPDLATTLAGEGNRAALHYLRRYPDWPSPVALLVGPQGSGKTHLGRAWAGAHGTTFIDDAERVPEGWLFAELNRALAGDGAVLLASRRALADWEIDTPDLASRLGATPTFRLGEVGDDILRPVLARLFEAHGRGVGADVLDYMLARCSRNVGDLQRLVDGLEADAQSQRADVTKAFVSRWVQRQPDLFGF